MTDANLFICDKTKWTVQPLSVTPCGFGCYAWSCPCCDTAGHTIQEEAFNPAYPGLHYVSLVPVVPPVMWPLKVWRRAA